MGPPFQQCRGVTAERAVCGLSGPQKTPPPPKLLERYFQFLGKLFRGAKMLWLALCISERHFLRHNQKALPIQSRRSDEAFQPGLGTCTDSSPLVLDLLIERSHLFIQDTTLSPTHTLEGGQGLWLDNILWELWSPAKNCWLLKMFLLPSHTWGWVWKLHCSREEAGGNTTMVFRTQFQLLKDGRYTTDSQ